MEGSDPDVNEDKLTPGEETEICRWMRRLNELKTMAYEDYLRTPEWGRKREGALERARGRCQGCDADRHLEVHHRTYEHRGFEMDWDLTVLCAACHTAVHLVADGRRGTVRSTSRRVAG